MERASNLLVTSTTWCTKSSFLEFYELLSFDHNFIFNMKFLKDVYCSIEYIISEVQKFAWPLCFFNTLCSSCGIEWDKSCTM